MMKAAATLLSVASALGIHTGMRETEQPTPPQPPPLPENTIKAVISGIDTGTTYVQAPPALVKLSHLPSGAAVWIEVYGSGENSGRRSSVKAHFIPRPDGEALLPIPALNEICDGEGKWSVLVRTSGTGHATTLARTTFDLRRATN